MSTNKFLSERTEQLASTLAGALRFGDRQADELVRLSRVTARQKRTLWRALHLIRRGRYAAAAAVMETDLCRDRKGAAR